MHRLPFNRSLGMLLLQFCIIVGTNGMFVQPMQRYFGDNLEVCPAPPSPPSHPATHTRALPTSAATLPLRSFAPGKKRSSEVGKDAICKG